MMAGTITTVLVSGNPIKREGKANEAIKTSELIQNKAGSIGTLEVADKAGSIGDVKVAAEWGSVDYGGSYKADERAYYYDAQPGDHLMVKVASTSLANGDIAEGDLLGLAKKTDGALANCFTAAGAGTYARAHGTLGTPATGTNTATIEAEVL